MNRFCLMMSEIITGRSGIVANTDVLFESIENFHKTSPTPASRITKPAANNAIVFLLTRVEAAL
jgi:hypothetical protein